MLKEKQKRIIAIVVSTIAIMCLFLPYAEFKVSKINQTYYYKCYKSGPMIVIILCILLSALFYGDIIKLNRRQSLFTKFGVSLCTLVLAVNKFFNYNSAILKKKDVATLRKIFGNNTGFHRTMVLYTFVGVSLFLVILNGLDLINSRYKIWK